MVSSSAPVFIYIITKERLDPDCRLYVSVSSSCAISCGGGILQSFSYKKTGEIKYILNMFKESVKGFCSLS